tara:strand:- start:9769 stop:11517 length:1749 start_codon:yes stop_codon:yes gene_type:complete
MYSLVLKTNSLLKKRQKKSLLKILLLLLVGMILEIFGLGVIVPLLSSILDPEFLNFLRNITETDNFFTNLSNNEIIYFFLFIIIIIYIIKTFFLLLITYRQNSFITKFAAELTVDLYNLYVNQPYSFHLVKNSATLIKNIQTEITLFRSYCMSFLTLIVESCLLISIIGTLIYLEPIGAISVSIFFITFSYITFSFTKKKLKNWGMIREKLDEKINHNIFEGIGGIKDLLILGRTNFFKKRLYSNSFTMAEIRTKHLTLNQIPRYSLELISVFGLVFFISTMLFFEKDINNIMITLGVFVAAIFRMIPSFNKVISAMQNMKFMASAIEVIYNEFNQLSKNKYSKKNNSVIKNFKSKIEIKNLKFKYSGKKKYILNDLNLTIPRGEFIGIIGSSGSGKSTLVDLFMGLLTPSKGEIIYDKINIKEDIFSWQKKIGYVPQNIFLIDDSIKNNIAFGIEANEIDESKLNNAIEKSQLKSFIDSLEIGYETKVGERGTQISGGQLQRIGIARALYNNPEILILDESTASLDTSTENGIMNSITKLKGDKTILMISHRFSSLKNCDKIYEIKEGKILSEINKFKKHA